MKAVIVYQVDNVCLSTGKFLIPDSSSLSDYRSVDLSFLSAIPSNEPSRRTRKPISNKLDRFITKQCTTKCLEGGRGPLYFLAAAMHRLNYNLGLDSCFDRVAD